MTTHIELEPRSATTSMDVTRRDHHSDSYDDVHPMFFQLKLFEPGSPRYARQRDAIIERCLPLASHIARRYRNRGEAVEDLEQVARIGLINAVSRFDPDTGSAFLSFAIPTMMGEVRRHFRDAGWAVKVPRRLKELGPRLRAAEAELLRELNRAPTPSELAAHLDVPRDEVVEALIAAQAYHTSSSDTPALKGDDDAGTSLSERLGAVDGGYELIDDVESVRPLIAALSDRDRLVLTMRFFENKSQSQIAEQLGVSQMQVSRILAKVLGRLRAQL